MTDLAELLLDCDVHGIRLSPAGNDGLTIDGPQDALTSDLIDRLKTHKAELLTALRPAIEPSDASAVWQAALDQLDDDPAFPSDVMRALRAADAHWEIDAETDHAGESIEVIEPPDPCSDCGKLNLWQTLAGDWRCRRCDPPHRLAQNARLGWPMTQGTCATGGR